MLLVVADMFFLNMLILWLWSMKELVERVTPSKDSASCYKGREQPPAWLVQQDQITTELQDMINLSYKPIHLVLQSSN